MCVRHARVCVCNRPRTSKLRHMCARVHTHAHTRIHAHGHMSAHACMSAHDRMLAHARMFAHKSTLQARTHAHTHTRTHARKHAHAHPCMHKCTHNAHTCAHKIPRAGQSASACPTKARPHHSGGDKLRDVCIDMHTDMCIKVLMDVINMPIDIM